MQLSAPDWQSIETAPTDDDAFFWYAELGMIGRLSLYAEAS